MPPGTTSCSSSASLVSAVVPGDGFADRRDVDVVGAAADLLVQAEQQRRGQAGHGELVADRDRLRQPDHRSLRRQGAAERDVPDVLVGVLAVPAPGAVLLRPVGAGGPVEHAASLADAEQRGLHLLAGDLTGWAVPGPADVRPADHQLPQVLGAEVVVVDVPPLDHVVRVDVGGDS